MHRLSITGLMSLNRMSSVVAEPSYLLTEAKANEKRQVSDIHESIKLDLRPAPAVVHTRHRLTTSSIATQ